MPTIRSERVFFRGCTPENCSACRNSGNYREMNISLLQILGVRERRGKLSFFDGSFIIIERTLSSQHALVKTNLMVWDGKTFEEISSKQNRQAIRKVEFRKFSWPHVLFTVKQRGAHGSQPCLGRATSECHLHPKYPIQRTASLYAQFQ
jgi:hypothetical protein